MAGKDLYSILIIVMLSWIIVKEDILKIKTKIDVKSHDIRKEMSEMQ